MLDVNCALVGPAQCGKSCVASKFCLDEFPSTGDNLPEGGIAAAMEAEEDGRIVSLNIRDTSSDMLNEIEGEETTDLEASYSSSSSFPESEDPLEPLRDCHVLILCFDLSRPYTYKILRDRWSPRLNQELPGRPRVAVGTKLDKEQESNELPKTPALIASSLGCSRYLTCSAKTGEGLKELFQYAAQLGADLIEPLEDPDAKKDSCLCAIA